MVTGYSIFIYVGNEWYIWLQRLGHWLQMATRPGTVVTYGYNAWDTGYIWIQGLGHWLQMDTRPGTLVTYDPYMQWGLHHVHLDRGTLSPLPAPLTIWYNYWPSRRQRSAHAKRDEVRDKNGARPITCTFRQTQTSQLVRMQNHTFTIDSHPKTTATRWFLITIWRFYRGILSSKSVVYFLACACAMTLARQPGRDCQSKRSLPEVENGMNSGGKSFEQMRWSDRLVCSCLFYIDTRQITWRYRQN